MTYRLSESERKVFNSAIDSIPEDIEYVVLRNYTQLPQAVPGVDIDILCPPPGHEHIQNIFFNHGFEKYTRSKSKKRKKRLSLIKQGLTKPKKTVRFCISTPGKVYNKLFDHKEYKYYTGAEGFEMNKTQYENLEVDFYNHLAHPSPSNNKFYRLDPKVEQRMLDNRETYNGFYVPSPVDEFAHLVCRGVFDHGGDFRDYYIERCESLHTEIETNKNKDELEGLFELIFFDATEVVLECIESGSYDQIKSRLKGYSNY